MSGAPEYPAQQAYPPPLAQEPSAPVYAPQGPPQGQPMNYPPPTHGQPAGYVQAGQPVVYQPAQPQQTVVYTTQYAPPMQTTYAYQGNTNTCCGGTSERFQAKAGLSTGVIQLAIGVLSVILTGSSYTFPVINLGYGITAGILFFIPAGVVGIVSKNKSKGVIIAYMVLSILCALVSIGMVSYECVAASTYSFIQPCDFYPSAYYECNPVRLKGSVIIHSILAVLAFLEFIISIVAAALCCGGLTCCSPTPVPAGANTTTMIVEKRIFT
ncbi:uncharacterized protein [Diadema setosum]|uniref:uncharacterized protein n=1 Tax=Diadema setosum TaxID=31175 RepID=UPI003B3B3487